MINFFRKIFKSDKKLILVQILGSMQSIQSTLTAIQGDSKSKGTELKLEVQAMSKEVSNLTKMIYNMVESLSKYFKIEVEFMEKEKEKMDRKPTKHDAIF